MEERSFFFGGLNSGVCFCFCRIDMVKMMDFLTLVGFKFFQNFPRNFESSPTEAPRRRWNGARSLFWQGEHLLAVFFFETYNCAIIPKYIEDVVRKTQFTLRLGFCLGILSLSLFSVQMYTQYTLLQTNLQEKIGHVNFILFFLMVPSIFCIVIAGLRMC